MTTDTIDTPPGTAGFLHAAHTWATDILKAQGGIPGVMIFGRGEGDEREMLLVFPSSNDHEQYATALRQQAGEFNPDIAIWVNEGTLGLTRDVDGKPQTVDTPSALFFWRERTGPTRAQYAVIAGDALGPANSMLGEHMQPFLDIVFQAALH